MVRERGFAMLLLVSFVFGAVLAVILGYSAVMALRAANNTGRGQDAYLKNARIKIHDWYFANAATIDALNPPVLTPGQLFAGANIVKKWGIRAAISATRVNGNIDYRTIALWIDNGGTASVFDPASGSFTPGSKARFAIVNGYTIETAKSIRSLDAMIALSTLLQKRFNDKFLANGGSDFSVNYFRPADPGCNAVDDEIPCTDAYPWEPATSMNFGAILGLQNDALVNAWGIPIDVCNAAACGANAASPPYSMLIRSTTPWGVTDTVLATQTL